MPHLTEIPAEILEQIFLHLPGQDIVKMEVVQRIAEASTRACADSSVASSRSTNDFRT